VVIDNDDIWREWSEWAMRVLEEGGRDAPSEGRGTSREAMLRKGDETGRRACSIFFCQHSLGFNLLAEAARATRFRARAAASSA
jgi:hypothetical protein